MKKTVSLLVCLCMIVFSVGCSGSVPPPITDQSTQTTESNKTDGGIDIAYSVPDTTNPFVGWLTGEVKKQAEADGLTVQVADAGSNSAKQIEQIENFIAMKVKVLALMPVDPNAMPDIIKKAQEQGIKVMVAGTDTGVYDVMMNTDQYNMGEQVAEMGIEWLLKTFSKDGTPEGFEKKPKVVIVKYTQTNDGKNRSDGIMDTMNKWGFADVVVAQAEAITAAEATTVMENMWQQNNDTALVMTYNADSAMGINEYLMGLQGVDKSKLAVFSGDSSDPIIETINASPKNESVFRGTLGIVGPTIDGEKVDLPIATYNALKGLCDGELVYGDKITDAVTKIYPEE